MQVQSLGREDLLEEDIATYSSILAWRIHGQRSLVGYSPWGSQRVGHDWSDLVLGCNLKNNRMISVRFQGKPFNITVTQVYAPTSNAEEAEVERFYEDQIGRAHV